eukprot:33363-Rhodomonas_salina.2
MRCQRVQQIALPPDPRFPLPLPGCSPNVGASCQQEDLLRLNRAMARGSGSVPRFQDHLIDDPAESPLAPKRLHAHGLAQNRT